MRNSVKLIALALTLPAAAALASETAISADAETKIRSVLTSQGFEVTEVEAEDGMFEAEATKDGKEYEFYLNDQFEVVKVEEDSEDD
ncbi:PepSY domain-containing protein [Leisingera sp. S132]|uniref:PepSY domain-containing protein n=1 Tax=Leisingera sp. S132 TaxID=2867016 RepID=UPI0021A82ED5|nr:PepSY domain-containing protein [Leisingera sp. S132]UWQ77675.1 PepSY domain-containing protein [Leisingera sp. S132]